MLQSGLATIGVIALLASSAEGQAPEPKPADEPQAAWDRYQAGERAREQARQATSQDMQTAWFRRAVQAYRDALELGLKDHHIYTPLGDCEFALGHHAAAVNAYTKVIHLQVRGMACTA